MTAQATESDALLITHRQTSYSTVSTVTDSNDMAGTGIAVKNSSKIDTGEVEEGVFSWKKLWKYSGPGKSSCYTP
jgi:hypothetical protein